MAQIGLQVDYIISNTSPTQVTNAYANLNNITSFNELLTTEPVSPATGLARNQIMHMAESWRYLGSAMTAFLNNSDGNAIHLAYYAELRATMSLFAGSGILIRNGNNGYIDSSGALQSFNNATYRDTLGNIKIIQSPTHKITWGLWEHWSKSNYAKDILDKGIILYKTTPQNIDLRLISGKIGTLATNNILNSWGTDLLQLQDDHNARNLHSYQAYWSDKPLTKRNQSDIDYIKSLWKLLLPQDYNQEGMHFDVAMIKHVLNEIDKGNSETEDEAQELTKAQDELSKYIYDHLGIREETFQSIMEQTEYDLSLFELANDPVGNIRNVLSRAVFLCRIAKLSVELNLKAHSNGYSWILYWLQHVGVWNPDQVENPYDLFEDYENALSDFSPTDPSFNIWHTVDNTCPASMLSKPEACLSWSFN